MLTCLLVTMLAHGYELTENVDGIHTSWSVMPVPWRLDPAGAPPGLSDAAIADAIGQAFESWQAVPATEIRFTPEASPPPEQGGGLVRFEEDWAWDPELVALTFTWVASDGEILDFEIVANASRSLGIGDGTDLQSVLVHEVGHALGIGHSEVGSAVMYPEIDDDELRRSLDSDDQDAARALYGDGTVPVTCATAPGPSSLLLPAVMFLLALRRRDPRGAR